MVTIGGIVEIAPLFYLQNTIEKVEGMRPYSPLELAGRDIYVREGCYLCHSQMIRPFRDEVERYGHYSLAAESMYDHPFQWGSKRTGPDLARVGGRYSNEWHVAASDRPALGRAGIGHADLWLPGRHAISRSRHIAAHLIANRRVGVPYTDEMIENAAADLTAQADPNADTAALLDRYPKAEVGDFDGDPGAGDRDGCAGRLSADARHAGRLSAYEPQPTTARRPRMDVQYHAMRTFADSWGLLYMAAIFVFVIVLASRCGPAAANAPTMRLKSPSRRTETHGRQETRPQIDRASPASRPPAMNGTGSRN